MVTSSGSLDFGLPTATNTTKSIENTTHPLKPNTVAKPTAPLEIEITPAHPSDAPAIARVGAQSFSDTFGFSVPASDLASFLAETYSPEAILSDIHDAPAQMTFVARSASASPGTSIAPGTILGFVQLVRGITEQGVPGSDPARHAELRRLYVDGAAQGCGVGSKLMSALEQRAADEGFEYVWLSVWEDNAHAQRIYERRGYVRVGALDFATGGCIQTDWVMAKKLV
ncbi:acyl-CoA N-acyltransferase [Camillea tinctor]|nr:acyl-CoA N-acyltransferase [Camillea tinctor]